MAGEAGGGARLPKLGALATNNGVRRLIALLSSLTMSAGDQSIAAYAIQLGFKSPVAIPTQTCKGEPASVTSFGTASTRLSPARTVLGLGVAEIGENPVAHVFCDEAAIALNQFSATAMIGGNDAPQILGVEPGRQRRRARKVSIRWT
jgi:hypothetical protein